MTYVERLRVAGWLAIVMILLMPALWTVSIWEAVTGRPDLALVEAGLSIGMLLGGILLVLVFKELLNRTARYRGADGIIWVSVAFSVFAVALHLVYAVNRGVVVSAAFVLMMVAIGIVAIVYGVRLLSCPDRLGGLLKPLAVLSIVMGSMTVTILLALPASLLFFPAYVLYALIFFRTARRVEGEEAEQEADGAATKAAEYGTGQPQA